MGSQALTQAGRGIMAVNFPFEGQVVGGEKSDLLLDGCIHVGLIQATVKDKGHARSGAREAHQVWKGFPAHIGISHVDALVLVEEGEEGGLFIGHSGLTIFDRR